MINVKHIKLSEKVKITIALCVSILILTSLGIYANLNTIRYKQSMKDVNHSGVVITQSQDILTAIQDVQSAYRGYIITNDSSFLKSFDIASRILHTRTSSISKMAVSKEQRMLLDTISNLVKEQRELAYSILVKRKYISFLSAWNLLNSSEESRITNKLRYYVLKFINLEKVVQAQKLKKENENFNKVIYILTLSVIAAVLITLSTLIYIRKIFERLVNTEALLLKSQLRLETILDKLPIGVIIVNKYNNEYHANNKAIILLDEHLSTEDKAVEMMNGPHTFSGALNPELRDKLLITNAIRGEENIGFNETVIEVNGKNTPFRVSAIPLYNEKNELEYAISVFDDISNIKQFENELIEAKKLVEESLKLKESFLSNMSHEIRTPINAILGFAELLDKRDLGTQENEYIRIIRSAGENLLRLLNDILDFSKLESNMMVFEEHPVSIDGILNSIVNLFLPKAKNKGLTLVYECDKNIPEMVVGDPVRLTQVITNIVGNAIKFTPKGSVLIFAHHISTDKEYTTIRFDIKDSGIGISKDKLAKVFRRFEQAGVETTRFYGGTGLGLSIAKHIVESQGGKISVTSELGIGSVFSFTMPFKNYDASKASNNITLIESIDDLSFLEHLKILLVEDNLLNIKLINGIFLGSNVAMDIAETGKQTIEKLKENSYDLILMDIELPDMNGYDITRLIRRELKLQIPIIALTAHALAGEKERCLESGMNDYLTKPVNTKQLFEKIGTYVSSPSSNKERGVKDHVMVEHKVTKVSPVQKLFSTNQSVVDLNYLHELSDNNKEFEKEVIELFLQQAPQQLEELDKAVNNKDYPTIKMIAHKLKSSTAVTIGRSLSEHFELLEETASHNELTDNAINSYNKVKEILHLGIHQLQGLLKTEYNVAST